MNLLCLRGFVQIFLNKKLRFSEMLTIWFVDRFWTFRDKYPVKSDIIGLIIDLIDTKVYWKLNSIICYAKFFSKKKVMAFKKSESFKTFTVFRKFFWLYSKVTAPLRSVEKPDIRNLLYRPLPDLSRKKSRISESQLWPFFRNLKFTLSNLSEMYDWVARISCFYIKCKFWI